MIIPEIKDEFAPLKKVILGTAEMLGGTPSLEEAYDPKSREHIVAGTFPLEADLIPELEGFRAVLEKYGVDVLRPEVITDYNQIFTRDIGFVIDNTFMISNVIEERNREIEAIEHILESIPDQNLVSLPNGVRIEGGDIMPVNGKIFIGFSGPGDFEYYKVARTNIAGVEYVREQFPDREVHAFELRKSDTEPRDNALHLDCCFQPLGLGHALLYPGGFKNPDDVEFITSLFGQTNIIELSRLEMYDMQSNLFSIAPDVVVSEKGFTRLNRRLRELGYTVEEIKYSETAKMEGLLRCSTLPILRHY